MNIGGRKGMIESLVSIALMCCCLYMYWRVRLRRWLVLALGFFLSTSNIISVAIMGLISIFVYPPPFELFDWVLNLELVIWATIVAIGLGTSLKQRVRFQEHYS